MSFKSQIQERIQAGDFQGAANIAENADDTIEHLRIVTDRLVRDLKAIKPSTHVGIQMGEHAINKSHEAQRG